MSLEACEERQSFLYLSLRQGTRIVEELSLLLSASDLSATGLVVGE